MSVGPEHETFSLLVPAAALDILESDERQLVLEHARNCDDCAQRLKEYREVIAILAIGLPPQSMAPHRATALRARLLSRARGGKKESAKVNAAALAGRWSGWAVAAALGGLLLVHHAIHRPLNYGWLLAGGLIIGLVALGVYAGMQRARISFLRNRLAALEKEPVDPDQEAPTKG